MSFITIVTVSVWLLWAAPAQAAEQLWLCHQQDGSEIYTTDPSALKNCKQYTPPSGLTTAPELDRDRRPADEDYPRKSYKKAPAGERHSEEKPKPKGDVDFETFRMLSTGMTEAEILTRAGSPKYIFRIGYNVQRWVYTEAEWLIEVTFTGGRVANIDWYRPRP
ncbi:MAG: hypothetical protein HY284_05175 [Nitrospirae bacterium]|nr:hypothetical protein [Nitrospirota bacterium]